MVKRIPKYPTFHRRPWPERAGGAASWQPRPPSWPPDFFLSARDWAPPGQNRRAQFSWCLRPEWRYPNSDSASRVKSAGMSIRILDRRGPRCPV